MGKGCCVVLSTIVVWSRSERLLVGAWADVMTKDPKESCSVAMRKVGGGGVGVGFVVFYGDVARRAR
eukprot:10964527-Alexandrium_andersonii.AAC.1